MRLKRIIAIMMASLFATAAIACASVPENESNQSSRNEREVPDGYF